MRLAAALDVQTSRPMARFAADVLGIVTGCLQARVSGRPEIPGDLLMTFRALFGSYEFRTRDARRRKNRAVRFQAAAREQNDSKRSSSPDAPPEKFLAFTVEPFG
jgi:hypothetical protein